MSLEELFELTMQQIACGLLQFEVLAPRLFGRSTTNTAPASQLLHELASPEDVLQQQYRLVLELVGENDEPIPHAAYRVVASDGWERTGRLDADGRIEIRGLSKDAPCAVAFPELDGEAWEYIHSEPL